MIIYKCSHVCKVWLSHYLIQLKQVETVAQMRALLDDELFDLRCTCGITMPSNTLKLKDLSELIRNICLHFVLYAARSELDQIRDGLRILGLLKFIFYLSSWHAIGRS